MDITPEQFKDTFETNIFGMFFLSQAAVPYLSDNDTIINTTSVTAYRGSGHLIDYASTKGAIVSFTRSLATTLMEKNIRVNGVAPGPIYTPLIPATFDEDKVENQGGNTQWVDVDNQQNLRQLMYFLLQMRIVLTSLVKSSMLMVETILQLK